MVASPAGQAATVPGIKSTILSGSASWMSSKHSVSGMEISIDFGSRFPGLDQPTVQYSASSSAGEVVSAEMAGNQLKLTVLREGVVAVSVTGQDQSGSQMTDRFEVYVTKVGDITGDGLITPADSLYIQQVIKGTIILSPDDLKRLDLNGDGKVTSADTSIVANLYLAQSRGTLVPEYVVTVKDVNEAPVADQVIISGTAEVGRVLTGSYRYVDLEGDAEAASSPRWYRGATPDGYGKTEIAGATATTYTVQAEDAGGFLFFAVMPGAATGTADGTDVVSSASSLIPIPDTQAPTLIGTAPTPGAAGVVATEDLTLTFSEPVSGVSGRAITIYRASDNAIVDLFDAADTARVVVAGQSVMLASAGLATDTAYYVQVEAGAFQDAAGNLFAGIDGAAAWEFTTVDTMAPTVTDLAPTAASPVPAGVTPAITFSEAVSAVTGKKITFHLAGDNSVVATYDAADATHVTVTGQTVTLANPGLISGTAYYIQVEAGAFQDAAGNPFDGIGGPTGWSFTTAVTLSLTALPEAGPLTEINLDGAVVMLFADGGIWNEGVTADHFQLNNAPPGTSIIGAIYMGDQVWVQLTQDGTDFDGGVMNMTVTAKPGAFQGGGQEVTSNPLTVDAVVEQPSAYISEYLNSGGQRSGFEVFFPATPEGSSIYTVEVHQWISATSSKRIVPITLNTTPITWPGFTYVVIETRWYSFFDEPGIPATYYNDELAFADSGAVVQALVLKKDGQVIDTLGDTSNRYAPLLAWGGTLVRRSSVIGGSNVYRPNQWTSYPAETFGYFGKHTQY